MEGSMNLTTTANRRYKQLLEEYKQPAIDPAIKEELIAYVEKRKASMPDKNY